MENDQALFVTERQPQHSLSIDLMRYIIKRIPKVQYMKEQNPESIANFFLGFCGPVSRLVFITTSIPFVHIEFLEYSPRV